jgi:RimJ/RimL family protein N-acetyltransferase
MHDEERGPAVRPLINIEGELVALGPLRRDLMSTYQQWMNHFPTVHNLGTHPRPITPEQEESWYEAATKRQDAADFTMYERASWRPIGNTGLMEINLLHRTAVFGILIGEPDMRGKGYGTEATRLVLDYAFTVLSLHSVHLTTDQHNLAGQRAYRKAGFIECGRQRQNRLKAGVYHDTILMDCLASEFTSPVLARLLAPDDPR